MSAWKYKNFPLELVISSLLLSISVGTALSFACFKLYIKHLSKMYKLNFAIAVILALKWFYLIGQWSLKLHFEKLIAIFFTFGFLLIYCVTRYIQDYLENFRWESYLLRSNQRVNPNNGRMILEDAEWSRPNEIDTIQFVNMYNIFLVLTSGLLTNYPTTKYTFSPFTFSRWKTFFEPNFTFYLVPVLLLLLNYYLVSRWRWIRFYRDDSIPVVNMNMNLEEPWDYQRVVFNFFMCSYTPILPRFFWSDFKDAVCTIDFEDKPTTFFCSNHMFHVECMLGLLSAKCEQILDNCQIKFNFFENAYTIRLFQKYMPLCPNCATFWEANTIDVQIENENRRLVVCHVVLE